MVKLIRYRYVAIKSPADPSKLLEELREAFIFLYGLTELCKASIKAIKTGDDWVILRVRHVYLEKLLTAIYILSEHKGYEFKVSTSNTLKTLLSKASRELAGKT